MAGYRIRLVDDPCECAALWTHCYGRADLFTLWEVRACFDRAFNRPPHFLVAEAGGHTAGLLPLSEIQESGSFSFFPGETWHGATWLEGNRIHATHGDALRALFEAAPRPLDLRYLEAEGLEPVDALASIDEINYRFLPAECGYSFARYLAGFSSKARKKINREIEALNARGVAFRIDHRPDLDRMFEMNLQSFGNGSYFADPRFRTGFENLAEWLATRGALRITTVLIGGTEAAVDMGAIWCGGYTLLAGGTRREFPGVAKLINLHHMQRSCRERFDTVDFLSGDFGWKERFRLTPRPYYRIAADASVETEVY